MIQDSLFVFSNAPQAYLAPDDLVRLNHREDYEYGPVAIYDVSQGLQVKVWKTWTDGSNIYLSPRDDTSNPTLITTDQGILEVSLAFTMSGQPVIAYRLQSGTKLHYYEPLNAGYITIDVLYAKSPMLTLDVKNTRSLISDVTLLYINDRTVCYRLQRERFLIEHTTNVLVPSTYSRISNVGMTTGNRLRITISSVKN